MNVAKKPSNINSGTSLIVSAIRYEAPVGKSYGYSDGNVISGKSFRSERARGETLDFSSFDEYSTWRKKLTSETMLVSGTFDAIGEIVVIHKGKEGPGEASASKKFLAHRKRPGILIGDIDFKEPEEVAGLFLGGDQPYKTKEAALDALAKICPEADSCALLIGWSTSSNIYIDTEQVKGTGGIRIYIPVTDASKIPYLLDILHKGSWLHSEGWAFVDKAGQFQERSLFDQALKTVTQPDYAAPELNDGLTQDREWEDYEGNYLEPGAIASLTPEEEERYQDAVAAAKTELAPEMEAQRNIWLTKNAKVYEKRGLSPKRALVAAVQLLDNGVLFPSGSVFFDNGSEVSVLELLTNGAEYDGKTCLDPVEPDYNGGASVGIFYWNDGGRPGVHSFAHGSRWYSFRYDGESLENVIESGNKEAIVRGFTLCELSDEVEYAQLETKAAKALGLGVAREPLRNAIGKLKGQIADTLPETYRAYNGTQVVLVPSKPTAIANTFLKRRYMDGSTLTLVEHFEGLYQYTGTHYAEVLLCAVRSNLYDFLEKAKKSSGGKSIPFNPKMKSVTEIMDAVKAKIHISNGLNAPCWLDDRDGPSPVEILAVQNGLLHLPSRELLPHDAAFFSLNTLTYDYDPEAPEPTGFLKFLDDLFGDDPEARNLLQEMTGYILSGSNSLQKILMIIGPKRSGKGTFGRVLVELVGAANTCSPRLESLGTNFGLQPLIGKTLAYMSDVRLEGLAKQQTIAENLLRISGEDDVNVSRKNRVDWYGRLRSRFLMLSNMVPRVADPSGALAGRFVTLVLTKSFYGKEDPDLTDRLLMELPGILNWALDGWDRLQEQGRFIVPVSSQEVMKELEYLSSPIQRFIDDECVLSDHEEVSIDELYSRWKSSCEQDGQNYVTTKSTFGRDLRAAVPSLQKVRKNVDGHRVHYYLGIDLRAKPSASIIPFPTH